MKENVFVPEPAQLSMPPMRTQPKLAFMARRSSAGYWIGFVTVNGRLLNHVTAIGQSKKKAQEAIFRKWIEVQDSVPMEAGVQNSGSHLKKSMYRI